MLKEALEQFDLESEIYLVIAPTKPDGIVGVAYAGQDQHLEKMLEIVNEALPELIEEEGEAIQ